MGTMASQITGVSIACSTIAPRPVASGFSSQSKGPVALKMFPFDDVIMAGRIISRCFSDYDRPTPPLCGKCLMPGVFTAQKISNAKFDICLSLQWRHRSVMASQITNNSTVCLAACQGWHQRKQQRFALLALCKVNTPFASDFPSQRFNDAENGSMSRIHRINNQTTSNTYTADMWIYILA